MKKFILVNIPSAEDAYHNFSDFVAIPLPIGILTIASVLEKIGYDVKILDADAENLSAEQTLDRIVQETPDYVGSTTMTAPMNITGNFYSQLKKRLPGVMVIVGGVHVSAVPELTLKQFAEIDICVIGEGDETIEELMPALEKNSELESIKGIAFRKNDLVIVTVRRPPVKNLEKTLIPAYHLIKFELYRSYGWNKWVNGYRAPLGVVFTGRGCIGKCNFCAAHSVFGRGIRFFPIDRIKSEIDLFVNTYKIRVLYFQDDTFTVNRKLVHQICDYLIEKKYNHRLEIMVSSRVDTVHTPTLKKMRQAGIRWICFGVESGNQRILDSISKGITIEQIKNAFHKANDAGLYVAGNYMIGHLGETWETAMDTIQLACKLKQDYASFAIALPFPGSELYEYCLRNDIDLPPWNGFGSVNTPPIPLNTSLGIDDLTRLRSIAVNSFFKRPSYIFRMLKKFNAHAVVTDFLKMYFAIQKEKKAGRF